YKIRSYNLSSTKQRKETAGNAVGMAPPSRLTSRLAISPEKAFSLSIRLSIKSIKAKASAQFSRLRLARNLAREMAASAVGFPTSRLIFRHSKLEPSDFLRCLYL